MIRKKGVILQTVLQVATVAEQELSIIKKASKALQHAKMAAKKIKILSNGRK